MHSKFTMNYAACEYLSTLLTYSFDKKKGKKERKPGFAASLVAASEVYLPILHMYKYIGCAKTGATHLSM